MRAGWDPGHAAMLLEVAQFSPHRDALLRALDALTGQSFGGDHDTAYQWVWAHSAPSHPEYARFKGLLYGAIDPRFERYFDDADRTARIRLDEIRWGGVKRDGIPPLRDPKMIPAAEASYLAPGDVVFGIEIEGDARAYPKRILAWHEMFKDEIGGIPVNGVYCTLCGSMILYRTEHARCRQHELGTSGFLYRSNKLMYDAATESLWTTLGGEPVVGPLADSGIRLEPLFAVTSTWQAWRERHPDTTVLSLDTGHERDYGEGVAYRSYFATDALMFTVPKLDRRLANKAEVLALRFGGGPPVAIDSRWLSGRPVHRGLAGDVAYVVLTDASGAHRVYRDGEAPIVEYDGDRSAVDAGGHRWRVAEDALHAEGSQPLARLPAHRAFWFGWHAAHPDTVLIP